LTNYYAPGFPEARGIVIAGNPDEAELLIVMRADEFHGIQRAALQRRVDIGRGHLGRDGAEPAEHLTGEAGDAELQPLEVVERPQFVAEPAAHLGAGVTRREAEDVVVAEQLGRQLIAAALLHPGQVLPGVQPEGQGGEEGEGGILAGVVVHWGVAALDGAGLHRIQHRKGRDDFAGREEADIESVVGELADPLGNPFPGAVEHVEVAREGRGEAPAHFRVGLGQGGGGEGEGRGSGRGTQDTATIHDVVCSGKARAAQ
jgi:hypothetical protein